MTLCGLPWSEAVAAEGAYEREVVALDGEHSALMALPLGEAPGATTVITAEEIVRSGAANIFELLRRVPGVDVRYTPMGGHIGIRSSGASPFSEQVLLLIDGRRTTVPTREDSRGIRTTSASSRSIASRGSRSSRARSLSSSLAHCSSRLPPRGSSVIPLILEGGAMTQAPEGRTQRCLVWGLTALLVLMSARCTPSMISTDPHATDPRLSLTTYYEEGRVVFLAADTNAAGAKRREAILPLAIMLDNKSHGAIQLDTESFTLVDAAGKMYPLISYEQFRREYRRVAADQFLSQQFYEVTNLHLGLDGSSLSPYQPEPLPFFGLDGPRRDSFELGPNHYTRGFLFFPLPDDGYKGKVLELHVNAKGLPEEVFVKFRVR